MKKKKVAQSGGAAQKLKRTTKKIVDEVLLKFVGLKVLARAQEMAQSLKAPAESKPKRKARKVTRVTKRKTRKK